MQSMTRIAVALLWTLSDNRNWTLFRLEPIALGSVTSKETASSQIPTIMGVLTRQQLEGLKLYKYSGVDK